MYIPTGKIKMMADKLTEAGLHPLTALAMAQLFDAYYNGSIELATTKGNDEN